jgi:hypothetical protein
MNWIANAMRVLALAALLSGGPVLAQKAPPTDPARIAAAKSLIIALGSDAQFKTAIETMSDSMKRIVRQSNPGKAKDIDDVFDRLQAKFLGRADEMREIVATLWAEKFTVAELEEIGRFFKTPIGAKMIAAQPEIMQKSMQAGLAWGQRLGAEVEAEARAELKKRGISL